jgi:hypothetical protein
MLVPAHIGFTLCLVNITRHALKIPPLRFGQLSVLSLSAILPDLFDKSIHLFYPSYPSHAIFHSLFLLPIFGIIFYSFRFRTIAIVTAIMIFHSILDLVNAIPAALVYPLFLGVNRSYYVSVGGKVMERLPEFFGIKGFHGHYILFEIIGALLVVWVMWDNRKKLRRTPCVCM